MLEITFRQMTPSDIDAVTELDKKIFCDDAWSRYIFAYEARNLHADYIVAEFENKIVAYVTLTFFEGFTAISKFAVAPEFRRRTLGKQFLEFILKLIRKLRKRILIIG